MQLFDQLGSADVGQEFLSQLLAGSRNTASLVCSASGEFVDTRGTSKDLGGEVDKLWLRTLRSHCDVVLTTGKTFRLEQYRMPRKADLGVLSRSPVGKANLDLSDSQQLIEFKELDYIGAALDLLQRGYRNIHVEYGSTGISSLLQSTFEFDLWLSGLTDSSVELGAQRLGVRSNILLRLDGLSIALAR